MPPKKKKPPLPKTVEVDLTVRRSGYKTDNNKPRWDLIPVAPLREIARVLTYNCKTHGGKYPPNNWKKVPGARRRYYAAMMRHITLWWSGEKHDLDLRQSHGVDVHHLASAGCCLLFLLYLDMRGELEGLDELDHEHEDDV